VWRGSFGCRARAKEKRRGRAAVKSGGMYSGTDVRFQTRFVLCCLFASVIPGTQNWARGDLRLGESFPRFFVTGGGAARQRNNQIRRFEPGDSQGRSSGVYLDGRQKGRKPEK
jgi:hypothetical protein